MQNYRLIQSEINFTKTVKMVSQSLEEISMMKIRNIRNSVIKTREYLTQLGEVLFEVKRSYHSQIDELKKRHKKVPQLRNPKGMPVVQIEKIDKPAVVLLSANTKMFGEIVSKVFGLFLDYIKKNDVDIIIVGRRGKVLYEGQADKKAYLYFDLPDIDITTNDIAPIVFHLMKYKKITVFYGKFENIITQTPTVSNVSGDQPFQPEKPIDSNLKSQYVRFLFEPSLETILAYFEGLITSVLFRQTVHEAQLARLASRILAMEEALRNSDNQLKKLIVDERRLRRIGENKRQIQRIAGISLWNSK